WLLTGTPVFPLGLSAETDALHTVCPDTFAHTFFGSGDAALWVQYGGALWKLAGPCQIAAALLSPFAAIWLSTAAWRRGKDCDRHARIILAGALLSSVLVFSLTPYTVSDDHVQKINGDFTVVRYSECPVALALIAMGAVLDDLGHAAAAWRGNQGARGIIAIAPGAAFAAVAVAQVGIRCREVVVGDALMIGANLGLAAWLAREVASLQIVNRRWALLGCAAAALGLSGCASSWLAARWHAGFAANFDHQFTTKAFTAMESAQWQPVRIAVVDYQYYPFFGSRRQFRAHRPFRIGSRESLLAYIEAHRIELLAVIRNDVFKFGRYRGADDWARQDTARFTNIDSGAVSGANFNLYRVSPPRITQAGLLAAEADINR
ncbi:MAG: hypothetical protein ACREHD_01485, partial [Pirellulales bacterium]